MLGLGVLAGERRSERRLQTKRIETKTTFAAKGVDAMNCDKIMSILIAVLVLAGCAWADDFVLVQDGVAQVNLVLSARPSDSARTAVADLQSYIEEMSGAVLPIVETDVLPDKPAVLVGDCPAVRRLAGFLLSEETLGYDGFIIKRIGKHLVVAGRDTETSVAEYNAWGSRFAAFALLEELGCRFFAPYADGEHIPQAKTLKVGDLNIISKPDFRSRQLKPAKRISNTFGEQTHRRWDAWSIKNRFGGIYLPTGHNYDALVPPRLFDEHPEYFAYERRTGNRTAECEQPCLSNPDVVKLAVDYCRRFFERRPLAKGVSLSPADEPGWCQCDRCLAMDDPNPDIGRARRLLEFNNRVAEQVTKTHPDKLFSYYCEYVNLPGPPINADGTLALQGHPAVVGAIVNRFCYMHDINDPTCSLNVEYRRRLDAWRRVTQFQVVYEYFNHNFEVPRMPTPQNWLVGPRIKYYRDIGMISYHGRHVAYTPGNVLNTYIAGKMLWDADQDADALLEEFFVLYFQEAADEMREFYRAYNQVGRGPEIHRMFVLNEQWTPEVFAELKPLLAAARAAAKQPVVQRRVERQWTWLRAYELLSQARWSYYQWSYDANDARREQAKLAAAQAINFFEEIADQDIVADDHLIKMIKVKYQSRLEKDRSFHAGKASGRPGYSDEETFGDLWDTYELIADLPKEWKFHEDNQGMGIKNQWYARGADDCEWQTIRIGEFWSNQGHPTVDIGWYRVSMPLGRELAKRKLMLYFGAVDVWAHVWVNGHDVVDRFCHRLEAGKRFSVNITPCVKLGQDNLIVVRVQDYERQGGIWKSIKLVSPK